MSNKIDENILKFNLKKDTHPVLSSLWCNYLINLNTHVKTIIEQSDIVLSRINTNTVNDIPFRLIMTLYCIRHSNMFQQ